MHVILIAVVPVDASGEAVLFEDLLDLAVDGQRIGVVLRIKELAAQHIAIGIEIGVLLGVDVDGGSGIVFGFPAAGPVGDDGADGILLLALVDLLEDELDRGHQIFVDIEGPVFGDLFRLARILEIPDLSFSSSFLMQSTAFPTSSV